jgi:phosphate starvation-inducible protein PhoH and related proteins
MSLSELIIDIPAEYEMNVFGQFDTYIKKIERTFHVTLISRDGATKIVGDTIAAQKAQRVLTQLVELAKRGNTITEQNVDYAISLVFEDQEVKNFLPVLTDALYKVFQNGQMVSVSMFLTGQIRFE